VCNRIGNSLPAVSCWQFWASWSRSLRVGCGSSGSSSSASTTASANSSGASQSSGSGGSFKAVFVAPLSGPLAGYAQRELTGFKAAAQVLNASGGILGHKVVVQSLDDGAQAPRGLTLLNGVVSGSSKPVAVYAGIAPVEALAYEPLLAQKKILALSGTGVGQFTSDVRKYPNFYSTNLPYQLGWATLGTLTKQHGWKTAYPSTTTTPPGSRTKL
jgi:hypothetical protein